MKRIFLFFLSMVVLCCGLSITVSAQQNAQPTSSGVQNTALSQRDNTKQASHLEHPLAKFGAYIHSLREKALQTPPQQATDLSLYNIITPAYLMQTDANPLSGTQGYGDWVENKYGRFRLVSCRSGFAENQPIWFGIQAELNKDWIIHKPVIHVLSDVQKSFVAYPLQHPLPKGYTQTSFYAQTVMFPVMVQPKSGQKSFQMDVSVDVIAENLRNKQTIQDNVLLSVSLQDGIAFDTGICPYIKKWIELSALPAEDFVKVTATLLENNDIHFLFEFHKAPDFVSVQTETDWVFQEQQNNIQGRFASYLLTPKQPVVVGDKIPLRVITNVGRFEIEPILQQGEKKPLPQKIPVGQLLLSGLLLVLTTPLWGFFLLHPKQSAPNIQKQSLKIIKVLLCTGILWCLSLWFHFPDLIQINPIMCFVFLGCYGALCWKKHTSLAFVVLGIFLLPKPYLYTVLSSVSNNPILFVICCLWWIWVMIWPFLWWKWYPQEFSKFYKFIFKYKKQASFVVVFPFVCMMAWIVGGYFNTQLNKTIPIYQENVKNDMIDNQKAVLLFVENPVCFQCAWDKAVSLKTGYMREFTKSGKLTVMTVSATSEIGQQLRHHFETDQLPMHILYSDLYPDGFLVKHSFEARAWHQMLR